MPPMRFLSIPVLILLVCPIAHGQPTAKDVVAKFRKALGVDGLAANEPCLTKFSGQRFMYSLTDGVLHGEAFEYEKSLLSYTGPVRKHRLELEMKIGIVPLRLIEAMDG